jgi:hypothetical protein
MAKWWVMTQQQPAAPTLQALKGESAACALRFEQHINLVDWYVAAF